MAITSNPIERFYPMKTLMISAAALMLTASASFAEGDWGGHHNWGGDGTTGASFEGEVFSTNMAGTAGGYGETGTENWKYEEGEAGAVQSTNGPDGAFAGVYVATGGEGYAWNVNGGGGMKTSETFVQGSLSGAVEASAFSDQGGHQSEESDD
jgi:hypothetical protein